MNPQALSEGLAQWLCIVVIITVHEFGHAWMATRCGDDTARLLGRLTLNPLAHIDPIGTVALPLLALVLILTGSGQIASFIIGWGKPVPFNPGNLRRRGIDDMLIAMAGPAMNVLLTILVMVLMRALQFSHSPSTESVIVTISEALFMMARISMFLCFFNLMPIPPLDGSHVLRYFTGMGYETYMNLSRFGFIVIILVIQIPQVNGFLAAATSGSIRLLVQLLKF
jgi:Zn-dependent protease